MEDTRYSTTDFYTTAVLLLKKYKIKEITTEGPQKKVKRFWFEDSDELRAIIMEYMNGDLCENLRDFRNSIDTVKDLVHSG